MNIFIVATILVIWFHTEAFVEYVNLFKIPYFKVKEYLASKELDCSLTYHSYLLNKHNNFFVRLITCPICVTFWLSIIASLTTNIEFIEAPFLFISSLLTYFIFTKLAP
jgi:hypothetical protein